MAQETTPRDEKRCKDHPDQRCRPTRDLISGDGVIWLEGESLDGLHGEEGKHERTGAFNCGGAMENKDFDCEIEDTREGDDRSGDEENAF